MFLSLVIQALVTHHISLITSHYIFIASHRSCMFLITNRACFSHTSYMFSHRSCMY